MSTHAAPLLRLRQVSKAFAAPVLNDIDLTVQAGEVLALTGENGAGKSTLSKIIAGLIAADAGAMELHGSSYAPRSRRQAEDCGVRMVLQELSLVSTLSIAENLQLGRLPAVAGFVATGQLEARVREQLQRVGLGTLNPSLPVSTLGIGQQQLLEIARGLSGTLKVLILDEPTAMLSVAETDELFQQIATLKAQGVGIIYISHRLNELERIADRIVVLRDGVLMRDEPAATFEHDQIVAAMVGQELATAPPRPRCKRGAELLRCAGITLAPWVRNVNFALHAGEILGIAGLVGSGRTQLLRLIFGADRKQAGQIYVNAKPANIDSPAAAVRQGIGLLTEDRKSEGLLLQQSLAMNLTVADLGAVSWLGWLRKRAERSVAGRWIERLHIRSRDAAQDVDELSGGNQQKVLLARWLHRDCQVLLLDEPTRGVDIGARADLYVELEALAAAGKALVVVSSDLRELMMLCDRIAVMSAGSLAATFERDEWSEQALLSAAFSGYGKKSISS